MEFMDRVRTGRYITAFSKVLISLALAKRKPVVTTAHNLSPLSIYDKMRAEVCNITVLGAHTCQAVRPSVQN